MCRLRGACLELQQWFSIRLFRYSMALCLSIRRLCVCVGWALRRCNCYCIRVCVFPIGSGVHIAAHHDHIIHFALMKTNRVQLFQDSRRDSGESYPSSRRDSAIGRSLTPPPPKVISATRKRNDSIIAQDVPNLQESRPSTSSTASESNPTNGNGVAVHLHTNNTTTVSTGTDSILALPPPTIITSSVTPPATSPTGAKGRRDSTTQCGRSNRRDSKTSPDMTSQRLQRLQRQATTYDDSCAPKSSRRGSQPALSPDADSSNERRARRDSLSPDSASRGRRDSRTHLSPDRSRDYSPRRRERIRRQSSSTVRTSKSPESSSCCSSRDASPCARPPPPVTSETRPMIRRQSTTEEILISRGFRRQSTTEEMIRCRNFRRQSSQSDDVW